MENAKKMFYQKNWFVWLWLILFPPIGLILLWVCHKDKKKKTKIILSVVFTIWFVILMGAANVDTTDPTNDIPTTEQMQNTEQEIESKGNETLTSADTFIVEVKSAIQGAINRAEESIVDVELKDGDLYVTVDLSNANSKPLTMEDLAISRTGSITDAILELIEYDNQWNSITIDFGELGKIINRKADVKENDYGGRYFSSENFILE